MTAGPGAALEIADVSHGFGGLPALLPVRLCVPHGQFVALVGPSGCGKSTLLSLVAGLDPPTRGAIHRDGETAMVFQDSALFPWLNVRDNVAFGLEMRGVARTERRRRADEALAQVHLARFADAFPHELSGGMRQRAAIARALVLEPRILLMDEPFGALDAQTRALLQDELRALWERTRSTVVFVTHSIEEALLLSDRVVLFSARPGRVIGDYRIDAPRPRDLLAHPFLTALHRRIRERLEREVMLHAAGEHDDGWPPPGDSPESDVDLGADI